MLNLKKHTLFLSLFVLAFLAPFGAVIMVERGKNVQKIAELQADYLASQTAAPAPGASPEAVEQRKQELLQAMATAKDEYTKLLNDQSAIVAKHQTTKTVTTLEPVAVQKKVRTPTTNTKAATATKPTSTRKTKTS